MGARHAPGILASVLIGAGACGLGQAALAGESTGFVPGYPGSQLTLYLTHAIGARGPGASTFGLRFERATPVSADPGARYSAPLRHHSLVELQFARGLAPRMQFGPRVTWDMGRRRLEPTSMALAAWPMAIQPLPGPAAAAWVP